MSDSTSAESLLKRIESGHADALVELFSLYRSRLKAMVRFRMDARLVSRVDASDVIQDVYIDAHNRIRHFFRKEGMSFYIWLRQLTEQRLIDVHRHHLLTEKRNVNLEISLNRRFLASNSTSMAYELAAKMASPSQATLQAELIAQIEKALESMEDLDREVLALRHFEELRNSEVAEVLGLKEAAASNRYVRALSRLRQTLEQAPGFGVD